MDASALSTLSRLLDEALDRPPEEREAWLDSLGPEHEGLKPRLRRLLQDLPSLDTGFLNSLPSLALPPDPADEDEDGVRAGAPVGPYRLVRLLAEGGMGSVWLAERADRLIDRPVALKLPRAAWAGAGLRERIAREREILATLSHPHIARLYDAGLDEHGRPYLALEYVEGKPIGEHCAAAGLDTRARVRLFLQVLRAVAHAHGALVIHRDLKPSNILVTTDGQVRLLDFGIAGLLDEGRAHDSTLTAARGRALTPEYASPEQIAGQPLGVATDVYSLGVVLYELLCGQRPYRLRRDTPAALEEAILQADIRRPSELATDRNTARALRGDLDTIVLTALARSPEARYRSVDALADDLARYLDGRPVLARPQSRRYRARKFIDRHRGAVAATTMAAVALVVGASVAIWQARVARAEQARADQVKQFVTSMFEDVNPTLRGSTRGVTALDLLADAEQRLDRELGGQPAVRAELLRVIGQSYLGLGDMRAAARVLERAVREGRPLATDGDAEFATTELLLGEVEHYTGKRAEATARVGSVQARLARLGRTTVHPYARSHYLQALFIINEGRAASDEAETAATRARDTARAVLGPDHQLSTSATQLLGTVMRARGKPDRALELIQAAYESTSRRLADDRHPHVLQTRNDLGRALVAMGRWRDGVAHLKAVVANADATEGLMLQQFLGTLGNAQADYGELTDALPTLRRALAMDLSGGNVSPSYQASRHYAMGRALLLARQPEEAAGQLALALAAYESLKDRNMAGLVRADHAQALLGLGRVDAAAEALARVRASGLAPRHRAMHRAARHLGTIARLRGDRAQAEALLVVARDASANAPRERIEHAEALTELALLDLDRQSFASARDGAARALAILREAQGPVTPSQADALVALGRAHLALGQPAAARDSLQAAVAFWRGFAADSRWAKEAARWAQQAMER